MYLFETERRRICRGKKAGYSFLVYLPPSSRHEMRKKECFLTATLALQDPVILL